MLNLKLKQVSDAEKLALCPKIKMHGWWWRRFIPSQRRELKRLQDLFTHDWMHGGYEQHVQIIDQMIRGMVHNARQSHPRPMFVGAGMKMGTEIKQPGKLSPLSELFDHRCTACTRQQCLHKHCMVCVVQELDQRGAL